jgi:phytoene dehydrogenase-like protein
MAGKRGTDVIVVGGGLAGLAASAYLAREGRDVVLVEKAAAVGGRARAAIR